MNTRDCKHGHLARSCSLCELEEANLENTQLRAAIEARGFAIVDGDYVLADGSRSSIMLLAVDSEKLLVFALQARRSEKRLQEREESLE